MTIQGISGIEALTQLGFTAEQFSNMALVASMVNQGIAYGTVFQTLSGISSLVSVGIRLAMGEVPNVNRRMLVHGADDLIRHSLLSFPLDPLHWSESIVHALGDTPIRTNPNVRNLVQSSRWVVQRQSAEVDSPSGNIIELYATPGGTHQQSTPDWMLPLILGLSGDRTAELKYLQDASKKKSRK
ncbi:minor structural protein VP3 [Alphapolyomavirus cardiodermae]|nr:minor structural protein VP3 [Alphapolyomavirus cardiodermae]AGA82585.1 minor structural protein VP3 [Alphapolyomavirus cardiodermae]